MKPQDYVNLEKDYDFKKSYLNQTLWWKNVLIVPPICLLFVGLVGILYLFNHDKLVSFYIIPYLTVFVIGTIWLKAIKKYIQKEMMTAQGAFNICMARVLGEKDGYVYVSFVNNAHRHDERWVGKLTEDLSLDAVLSKQKSSFKNKLIQFEINKESAASVYVRSYFNKDIDKRNSTWREDGYFPVLFINQKYTPIVKKKDLVK